MKTQAEPEEQTPSIMIFLNGSKHSFRCPGEVVNGKLETCGCNCFHRPKERPADRYECNACGAWYIDDEG